MLPADLRHVQFHRYRLDIVRLWPAGNRRDALIEAIEYELQQYLTTTQQIPKYDD
jgi:hypothetical protein